MIFFFLATMITSFLLTISVRALLWPLNKKPSSTIGTKEFSVVPPKLRSTRERRFDRDNGQLRH
jgi:membrane protein insertase Oxa1/YidC/SpoIIIJ